MGSLVKVARVGEIPPGSATVVDALGEPVAIFNVKGRFYAIHNTCVHAGGPLGEGCVNEAECTVECPWHGWTYKLESGKTTFDPDRKVKTYRVKVQDDDVFLEL